MNPVKVRLQIDTWKKKSVYIFFSSYTILLIIFLIIASNGPQHEKKREFVFDVKNSESEFQFQITDLNRLNQFLVIDVHFDNSRDIDLVADIGIEVTLNGSNSKDTDDQKWALVSNSKHTREIKCKISENCTKHTLVHVPYLHYQSYSVDMKLTNKEELKYFSRVFVISTYMNQNMTLFELFFRYVFVIIFVIWSIFLTFSFRNIGWKDFLLEQKSVAILCIGLFCFDNPIWPTTILSHSSIVTVLDSIFFTIFFLSLLVSWLCITDHLRKKVDKHSILKFYIPRILPSLLIFIPYLITTCWERIRDKSDPQFENTSIQFLGMYSIYNFYLMFYSFILLPVNKFSRKKHFGSKKGGSVHSDEKELIDAIDEQTDPETDPETNPDINHFSNDSNNLSNISDNNEKSTSESN
ncbi:transmembrane protein [Anaeramoeba flamelloides]|uniref:Transmembrane protein n=1 Tax=Anaeramoeba flamelloides TaxID=1746091 RepID=A0ABQ8Y1C2_9EUKA|nr:transmembrane protein [Anaeramoeba flamelloides]